MINSYGEKDNWSMEDLSITNLQKLQRHRVKLQSLAPTKNAAKFHFLRIHPSHWIENTDERWTKSPYLGLEIIKWKLRAYLTDLKLCFIRCNCNISKKSPCNTNVCSCKRHRLPCVSACGNCNGVECENSVQQEVSSDEDSVESDEE